MKVDEIKHEDFMRQVQLKRAGEDREKQNKEFQMTCPHQLISGSRLILGLVWQPLCDSMIP